MRGGSDSVQTLPSWQLLLHKERIPICPLQFWSRWAFSFYSVSSTIGRKGGQVGGCFKRGAHVDGFVSPSTEFPWPVVNSQDTGSVNAVFGV